MAKVPVVRIKTKYGIFEGIKIPRSEFYNDSFITLKLNNGYNIGIKKSDILEEKEIGFKEIEKFPSLKIKQNKDLPKIGLISTGGTIASRVDYLTGGVQMAFSPEEILAGVPEIQDLAFIDMESIFNLASEDLTPKEWIEIGKVVFKKLKKNEGVIITHGTDTMHYTSSALAFMLENLDKPVILTGAQRSSDRGSSDAYPNLISSFLMALSKIPKVMVVMHKNLWDICWALNGVKVRKMHTERRDAFRPINDTPIAEIDPYKREVKILKSFEKPNGEFKLKAKFEKVGLIKVYPGSDPNILDFFVEKGYKGIIIEGTGFGHVPTQTLNKKDSWIPKIKEISQTMFVGITSQCIYGRTSSTVYRNLRILAKAGGVHLGDMTPETAYVKLSWVLGQTKDLEEVKKLMLTNLRGEISERSVINGFLI